MSDVKEAFPITADASTGAGIAPISRVEGDSPSSQAGLIGFSFKDSSGNLVLPQLKSDGSFAASIAQEPEKYAYGTNAGNTSYQNLATIVGTLAKKYHEFKISVSCFREAIFELVYIDDVGGTPAETVMGVWRCGPGQYTVCDEIPAFKDLTGGTGVQNFVLRGKNLDKASTMDASLACKEEL